MATVLNRGQASRSRPEPIGPSLKRLGAELDLVSTMVDEFEFSFAKMLAGNAALAASDSKSLQKLDQIKQHIDALSQYISVLSVGMRPDWQLDQHSALRRVNLTSVARRLAGQNFVEPEIAAAADGDAEIFFDGAPESPAVQVAPPVARAERQDCSIDALFGLKSGAIRGKIINLSPTGIGFTLGSTIRLAPGEKVAISFEDISNLTCTVRWGAHPRYGAIFEASRENMKRIKAIIAS